MPIERRIRPAPSNAWGPLPPHAAARDSRATQWIERLLLVIAVLCLGYYAWVSIETYLYQAYEHQELDLILRSYSAELTRLEHSASAFAEASADRRQADGKARSSLPLPARGAVIGRLEIPRLRVSTIVRAGTDARTLRLAVGHIAGTPLPGQRGNVGLAGHRDTFFRRLRNIRPEDEIRFVTPEGTFTYRVQRTDVVRPTDVWVLDPTEQPTLTLITCYPFTYIGSAPQRFIVRAPLHGMLRATANLTN
jgi:sortase A